MFERKRHTKEPKTTTVSVSLTAAEAERLYNICDAAGITVSKFIRQLIIEKI